ncbi:unnamed protein product [Effrenium voratum]|nr:unnamed protein product [Effrenium voratum]
MGDLELHIAGLDGSELHLTVADSLTGRQLLQLLRSKLPPRPGRLHVSFGEAKLVPDKTLREQISDCAACASFTFARPCLADAWSAVQTGEELEFSLEGITKLRFGEGFDHSLRGVILPESLQCLTFGDQSLDGVTLPSSLECLTLGKLCAFSSQDVVLPAGLKTLTLGDDCDQSLKDLALPRSLQTLSFGKHFDHSLEDILLPSSLQSLSFGECFNKSLQGIALPTNLRSLNLGELFNQPMQGVDLPDTLESLTFGDHFNQALRGVRLPCSLQSPDSSTTACKD